MKFNILGQGFVPKFVLTSKDRQHNNQEIDSLPAKLSITPSLHKKDASTADEEYGVTIKVSIENEMFDVDLEHFFIIKFDQELSSEQESSDEMRKALINGLYPYSRAFIVSNLANAGYGAIDMPTIIA